MPARLARQPRDGHSQFFLLRPLSHPRKPTYCVFTRLVCAKEPGDRARTVALRASAHRRPYATLLAKGEDRKQRILDVAQRLLARNGWRNTTLSQIAKEAGVTSAGLLHHFESKEQLLHAVLDARDADDDEHADQRTGDLAEAIASAAERFYRSPELVGTFTVLLVENIAPDAPLHDRLVDRYRAAVEIIAERIRIGQSEGRYRHRRRTRPSRPWRSSHSSTEWRPHGYSIRRFR